MVLVILAFVVAACLFGLKTWCKFVVAQNKKAKEFNEFLESYLNAKNVIVKNYSIFSHLGIEYYTDSAKQLIGIAERLLKEEEMAMEKNPKAWAKATFKEYKKSGDFNKFLYHKFAAIRNLFGEYGIKDFASYEIEKDLQKLIYRPRRR